ncbi:MAG: M20/M25/M40 family metallo-hydrolase [Armatimonadota bacterium]
MRQAARSLDDRLVQAILVKIDVQELLRLEQESVRIPSLTFEEHECARYFAREMERLGFDQVDLMEVEDPYGSGRRGLQPIGWLRGSGGGPGMMLNGHMDHVPAVGEWTRDPFSGDFDDGYVYGRWAHDDKGGIVAAIGPVLVARTCGRPGAQP